MERQSDGGQAIDTIASRFPKPRRRLDLYHTLVKVTERVREAFPDAGFEGRRAQDDRLSDLLRAGDGHGLVATRQKPCARQRSKSPASHGARQAPTTPACPPVCQALDGPFRLSPLSEAE